IGIGTGGHLIENETNARASVEMAWGRGGDQVAVKNQEEFKFYGSSTKDYEKSTRVKTRMFSVALKEMISQSDKVIIMGHQAADYDSFGASLGISRAAKIMNKDVHIVLDLSPAIKPLYDEMQDIPEYAGMIISPNVALEMMDKNTLLIILDTHRPSMMPAPELLNIANKVVLIDHHRRSTEFIENHSLIYLEPYASSTCEMVTEVLQYIDDKKNMTTFEATALYLGIFMDTKNFVTKTGVRTFEAASYLRRYGVNTMEAKKYVSLDFDEYVKRMDIIRIAEIWNTDIAVSICDYAFNNMRVISSQAADEMLNISGIKAAFVVYQIDNTVYFSARSFADVNVQLIMEKLGGGGHMTVAGCQIKNISLQEARDKLKDAIKEYIDENKK
ncbi:MAG: DHH family phosphoesterase, partial [Clostridia bacterium]|nr:DHH family phosphoesterase [Clostridia bacterium]